MNKNTQKVNFSSGVVPAYFRLQSKSKEGRVLEFIGNELSEELPIGEYQMRVNRGCVSSRKYIILDGDGTYEVNYKDNVAYSPIRGGVFNTVESDALASKVLNKACNNVNLLVHGDRPPYDILKLSAFDQFLSSKGYASKSSNGEYIEMQEQSIDNFHIFSASTESGVYALKADGQYYLPIPVVDGWQTYYMLSSAKDYGIEWVKGTLFMSEEGDQNLLERVTLSELVYNEMIRGNYGAACCVFEESSLKVTRDPIAGFAYTYSLWKLSQRRGDSSSSIMERAIRSLDEIPEPLRRLPDYQALLHLCKGEPAVMTTPPVLQDIWDDYYDSVRRCINYTSNDNIILYNPFLTRRGGWSYIGDTDRTSLHEKLKNFVDNKKATLGSWAGVKKKI